MECHSSESKKLIKVFDVSKRKRTRKKTDELHENNSIATDESNHGRMSGKASLQDLPNTETGNLKADGEFRERGSSPSIPHGRRGSKSPRRHRRTTRDNLSLALKAGMVSTPRSVTPPQGDVTLDAPHDQDSIIYAFLEDAIKKEKKKHHQTRKHEERRKSRDRERDASREHKRRHHRRREEGSRDRTRTRDKHRSPSPVIDQSALLETFAKLCVQMNEKNSQLSKKVTRSQSHKSLQCEASREMYGDNRRHCVVPTTDRSRVDIVNPHKVRSQEQCHDIPSPYPERQDNCAMCYDTSKYTSKIDVNRRHDEDVRYRGYVPQNVSTRTFIDYGARNDANREYRDYDRKTYDDKRRYIEQKTSRSFDVPRDSFDEERYRRSSRSDNNRRYDEKFYEKQIDSQEKHLKDRRRLEKFDRRSVVSREDEFRERDRYSERERDSGLSVADCETSSISGKSNYLRVVKQEIAEQREAMDKMMKLWKELMRCFKGISQNQGKPGAMNESAESVRESAAAQLRLWRECMQRYETVARDVGDTDARLMEEINKQRSEMAEMATMWQECLQRYRDMSNDFNSLKQKLHTPESPTRMPAAPLVCAEGEGSLPAPPYRMPTAAYPSMNNMCGMGGMSGGAGGALRGRASAPPWWWAGEHPARSPRSPRSPRRRSSPDSRASRDRDRDRDRRRHKDSRDESRYKEKSKPNAARSEHRHRKR